MEGQYSFKGGGTTRRIITCSRIPLPHSQMEGKRSLPCKMEDRGGIINEEM
jgi:hypothetical protein